MDKQEVKRIRLSAHLLQKEFAELLGVSVCTVCLWETGRQNVSILNQRKIIKFCEKYGIEI